MNMMINKRIKINKKKVKAREKRVNEKNRK